MDGPWAPGTAEHAAMITTAAATTSSTDSYSDRVQNAAINLGLSLNPLGTLLNLGKAVDDLATTADGGTPQGSSLAFAEDVAKAVEKQTPVIGAGLNKLMWIGGAVALLVLVVNVRKLVA